tara:strand:- start:126 stop:683 length:558 start_codon:yes stop_codon:yes gene_type:complete
MREYKALSNQIYSNGDCKLVPIRDEDKYLIMNWRNEQIYHLRQNRPLTKESQERYFKKVITQLFEKEHPDQLLFSLLKEDECIGYGGIVHINWIDKHAEISFIMNTQYEQYHFHEHWSTFLNCIEQVSFVGLNLHKLFVYAFDLRPSLYDSLDTNGYFLDARLKNHCFFNDSFKDVVIYSKLNVG